VGKLDVAMQKPPYNRGFTLIELSVVLLVIGLLVGGAVVGTSMIERAKQKDFLDDIQRVRAGTATFKMMYKAYPGDFANATSFFTAAASCPTGGLAATCNGNGDSAINSTSTGADNHESRMFAQHLASAEIIPGRYNSDWPAGVAPTVGTQLYDTIYPNIGIIPGYTGQYGTSGSFYDGFYGNYLRIGRPTTGHVTQQWMSCEMLSAIDKKFDNNKPGTGWIRAAVGQCTTDTSPTATKTAEYDPTQGTVTQALWLLEAPRETQ
jgi:prepilin-type N-terminal cleavage/methylation domain-containing protein